MSDVVNLNKARKARARTTAAARAAENRIAFGRSKAEKAAALTSAAKADSALDGHKREP